VLSEEKVILIKLSRAEREREIPLQKEINLSKQQK